jgi:phosphate/phosphite/phosphonate ABC transporter binding protein
MERILAGKYRLGRLLGEGGMGAVYEAEHTGLGVRVAVKLLSPSCAANATAVARFRREARAAAAIRHDHIVAVTDVDADEEGIPFIVMELLDGESLGAWMRRERYLPGATAAAIAAQVLAGLAATHKQRIIHRDLKPGNVMMVRQPDGNLRVKILDFGISKFVEAGEEATTNAAVVGTPRFMAPEQARGDKNVDQRADLYGVGELLYLMTTGRVPFVGPTREDLTAHIVAGDFPRPRSLRPEIDPALEAVILKAMATDAEARYPDATAMLDALRAAVPGLPAVVNPALPVEAPRRPRGWVVLVAALALTGVVAVVAGRQAGGPAAAANLPPLRFGMGKYLPLADVRRAFAPFSEYLASELGRPVDLQILDDYVEPGRQLIDGKLDLAALPAYNYVRAKREAPGLHLLAVGVTSDGSSYDGVIVVRADSGIDALAGLRGKRMCWVSTHSASGYLYPRAVFRRAGIDPDTAFSQTTLTGEHLASLQALRDGLCDGAAVYRDTLTEARKHDVAPEAFRVLASTDRIPFTAYVMGPAAPPELVAQVRTALLKLPPGTPTARDLFHLGENQLIGFAVTSDAAYDPVRDNATDLDVKRP